MSYHLFLDDSRQPKHVKWVDLPPVAWVVVKNYDEFVKTIQERGLPETISFDHDLADEHYDEYTVAHDEKSLSKGTIRYHKFKEKSGYECAKWLAHFCIDKKLPIPLYYVHTMNPIGRTNIISMLESARTVLQEDEKA